MLHVAHPGLGALERSGGGEAGHHPLSAQASLIHRLAGQRVLVTGGTGFIGGRLIERLHLEAGARVRVLVRSYARAFRIARLPVELVQGDVCDPGDVGRAAQECDAIVHCAYGTSGSSEQRRVVNVEGTVAVMRAASETRVKRVVHLSTVQVYGQRPEGDFDETAPRRYFGDGYSNSKLDAERLATELARRHHLPLVVIQPAIVYGPYGSAWTEKVLENLKQGPQILIDGGTGLCNAVYIDDVADAILLALVKEEAIGQAFLVSGREPVTWREFFARHERMLGISATVEMSAAEAKTYYARSRRVKSVIGELAAIVRDDAQVRRRIGQTAEVAMLRRVGHAVLPASVRRRLRGNGWNGQVAQPGRGGTAPLPRPLDPLIVDLYAAKARVRIDKARRVLGFEPHVDFDTGMDYTEAWARWANLLTL